MPRRSYRRSGRASARAGIIALFLLVALILLLGRRGINFSFPGISGINGTSGTTGIGNISGRNQCQSNCTVGSGAQGVRVFVEPEAGDSPITGAISGAAKSVWLEIYLLTDRNVISALQDTARRGIDVRVMLEPHPAGGGGSPQSVLSELSAAGAKTETTNPTFPLTHEKGMIIDGKTAFIMTSNFTRSALGGSSGSSGATNREYAIVDTIPQDVQAVSGIFQADWNRTTPHINDPNLVVSPVNSRNDFLALINNARHTLLIEAEEMQDSGIEQARVNAAKHGVRVEVILPAPSGSSGGSNSQGIDVIKSGGVQVREDTRLYMHAKIIVVDGRKAFVGSENISTQSLDQNRELGMLVSDSGVLNTLQQTFQQDWGDSQTV
jgi:cardiolipin synthase A/B